MASQTSTPVNIRLAVPTLFEMLGLLMLSLFIVVLGNSKQLLDYYGLSSSDQLIKHSTTQAIASGLSKLDTFSFTDKAVTFMVWAVIGVLCFSIVQVVARFYREFEDKEAVSSNRYIHPATFVRAVFWRRVVLNFFGTLIGLGALAVALYCLLAYVMPVALTYTREFLTGISLVHLGGFAMGFLMLYGWVFILTIILKLIVNRHRLANR